MLTIGGIAMSTHNNTEKGLYHVQLMWCEIIKITSSGNVRLETPWLVRRDLIVKVARGYGKLYLHRQHPANLVIVNDFLDTLEVRQIAPIISHEARHTGLL